MSVMMNNSITKEVLIVGGGPVGLTLAIQLQRFGIEHRIIDKRSQRQTFSKAFAIHSRTLEVFEDLGLLEQVLDKAVAVDTMSIYSNGKRLIHYTFDVLDIPYQMVASIPQGDIEEILESEYERLGGSLDRGLELTGLETTENGVSVKLINSVSLERSANALESKDAKIYHYRYLLACDGNKSSVRESLNIPFVGDDYAVPYIIADGMLDWEGNDHSGHVYVANGGYVMFFPLPGGRYRVVVDEPTGTITSENLTTEIVNEYIRKKGISNATFSSPDWLTVTSFRRRIIDNYQSGNIFFAGDACHVHSPIGGQGMNTGIQDAYNLGWKVSHDIRYGASKKLLSSYNTERRPVAEMVLQRTNQQMTLLSVKNPLLRFIRDLIIPRVAGSLKFQKNVVGQAGGFLVDYSNGGIVGFSTIQTSQSSLRQSKGKSSKENKIVGQRMADIAIFDTVTRHGNKRRIFDLLQGTHYSLFLIGDNGLSAAAKKMTETLFVRHNFLRIFGVVDDFSSPDLSPEYHYLFSEILCDVDREMSDKHGFDKNSILLVRPDGYVALSCPISDVDHCILYLEDLYCFFYSTQENIELKNTDLEFSHSDQETLAECL